MKTDKLTKDEVERLALKHLQHLDRQKEASAKRRAKLLEQGKTQITLMVSVKRVEQIKKMIKIIEDKDLQNFCLGEKKGEGWTITYQTE